MDAPPIDSEEDENRRKMQWESTMELVIAHQSSLAAVVLAMDAQFDGDLLGPPVDHRTLPRGTRRHFNHARARMCIMEDYLGPVPKFPGRQFVRHFRIDPSRFQRLMQDVMHSEIRYYTKRVDALGEEGSSVEARLLLPLKTLAYGVAPHCFQDYFQMSETMASTAMKEFDLMMEKLYRKEYLRVPTKADLKSIVKLHKARHKIDGMFVSLDCMHVPWKNCPVAWQGSYQGKEGMPTLVLEGASDHHMWFWSACFGYAGTLNDKTILTLSELFEKLINGSFVLTEDDLVPFIISGEEFNKLFILVDGIYPQWSRFVKGMKEPIYQAEKTFSEWQEAARKDIERAFGNLQQKFQYMARPIHQMDLNIIGKRVSTCLMLHNMCVSDRVMGDVYARYDPAFSVDAEEDELIEQPDDLERVQGEGAGIMASIGMNGLDAAERAAITRRYLFNDLRDNNDHVRLTAAIMREKVRQSNARNYGQMN